MSLFLFDFIDFQLPFPIEKSKALHLDNKSKLFFNRIASFVIPKVCRMLLNRLSMFPTWPVHESRSTSPTKPAAYQEAKVVVGITAAFRFQWHETAFASKSGGQTWWRSREHDVTCGFKEYLWGRFPTIFAINKDEFNLIAGRYNVTEVMVRLRLFVDKYCQRWCRSWCERGVGF